MTIYVEAQVGRAGLGNGLFPWARAEIFARQHSARVLAPRWAKWHLGPYLRGELDKRDYASFFSAPHHVRGVKRVLVKSAGWPIIEKDFRDAEAPRCRPLVIQFGGLRDLFAPLAGHRQHLAQLLWQMTRPGFRPGRQPRPFIAMHIRRGDLTRQGFTAEELRSVLQYTDITWFVAMARTVRKHAVLRNLPIVVFTDGSRSELEAIAAVDGVTVQPSRAAITDLLHLSQAALLFASGYSTFSMWASFLGYMPTVYAPGKLHYPVHGAANGLEIELGLDAGIPGDFASRVVAMSDDYVSRPG